MDQRDPNTRTSQPKVTSDALPIHQNYMPQELALTGPIKYFRQRKSSRVPDLGVEHNIASEKDKKD